MDNKNNITQNKMTQKKTTQNRMNNEMAVKVQYSDGKNLSTRMSIHAKYSTNQQGFGNWINQQYQFFDHCRILELGCGTADGWKGKLKSLGAGSSLILSDFSQGMVNEVKSKYSNDSNVAFEQINIENIPYEAETFDFVIANMMLYHVPNLHKALDEVNRVLKKNGVFYCATFGENGIQQYLTKELGQYGINIDISGAFTLQNGAELLNMHFNKVAKADYIDSLEITDTNDLVDYLYSMTSIGTIDNVKRDDLFQCFESMKNDNGVIQIPKEYGMFTSTVYRS